MFLSRDHVQICSRLMDKIEKNMKQPGNYFNRINTVLLKLILMIRYRYSDDN